jgi:hypothetical protein
MPVKTKRRPPTEEERAERRAAEREQMREAVKALRTSEGWQRWLRVRRHFHSYSFHNQLMIAMQCPEATRVAGFRKWLELGYAVRDVQGVPVVRLHRPTPSRNFGYVRLLAAPGCIGGHHPRTIRNRSGLSV